MNGIFARYDELPEESAIAMGLVAHYGFLKFDCHRASLSFKSALIVISPFHRLAFDREWDTDSFLFLGEPNLGGGDTQWWIYLVVKGSVSCRLAPCDYCHHVWTGERQNPRLVQQFGPGSVVVFSLINHNSGDWSAAHLPARFADQEHFDMEPLYPEPCDEWVRVCIEKPMQNVAE